MGWPCPNEPRRVKVPEEVCEPPAEITLSRSAWGAPAGRGVSSASGVGVDVTSGVGVGMWLGGSVGVRTGA